MSHRDFDLLMENYRRLDPAGKLLMRELVLAGVVERAHTMRSRFLHDLFRSLLSWYWQRAAIAQLQGLDDRALKDIGLHRSGIEAAVR
jgi:uncharacterized protein YjiS (DUF1127 family)